MRVNENTAVSTYSALLVPYDPHHVATYHDWMSDPHIQQATASEPLTIEEEYDNQQSWRSAPEKLTFIVCTPLAKQKDGIGALDNKYAIKGECDSPERMIGDVNLFLHPWQADDDDGENEMPIGISTADSRRKEGLEKESPICHVVGEIDIMIAHPSNRGKGVGKAAVGAFLSYIMRHLKSILDEYHKGKHSVNEGEVFLRHLMAKIQASNQGSRSLFKSLGFEEHGGVNYFGELELVMRDLKSLQDVTPKDYVELEYKR